MKIDGRWSFHSTGFMKHLMLWRFQIQFFLFDTIDQARIKHQWNGKWLESYTLSTLEMMREYKVKIKKFYHTWSKSWICDIRMIHFNTFWTEQSQWHQDTDIVLYDILNYSRHIGQNVKNIYPRFYKRWQIFSFGV